MKIVGLMLVRNEQWVLGASLRAALAWCDEVVVFFDRCIDRTMGIAHEVQKESSNRVVLAASDHRGHQAWDEMDMRQKMLEVGRAVGGTHFALIDADEILTYNYLSIARYWFEQLQPGQLLDVPMIPVWGDLDNYRNDKSVWCSAWLTLGVADQAGITWKPAEDGYQHHNRAPHGAAGRLRFGDRRRGGVMHLQFAHPLRLLAKHVLYRMVDHLRWPRRESIAKLNWKYDQALEQPEPGDLISVPQEWWGRWSKDRIDIKDTPYQEAEIHRLLQEHGREKFEGLDLKGY